MSVLPSVKYVKVAGAMVAKPINARVSGSWTAIQSVAGAPTSVTATAGDTLATVVWAPPANTGKIQITDYTVTSSPGNITATSASPTVNIGGLTNGTNYTFTVKTNNAIGSSVSSTASGVVIPAALTGKLYATPSNTSYNVGDTITVTIREDSLTTAVDAVQAYVDYDSALLQFVSSTVSASPFGTAVQNTNVGSVVQIALADFVTGTISGDQIVSTLVFTAVAAGATGITFESSSSLARVSDHVDICNEKLSASFTIS